MAALPQLQGNAVGETAGGQHPVKARVGLGVQPGNLGFSAKPRGQVQHFPRIGGSGGLVMLPVELGQRQGVQNGMKQRLVGTIQEIAPTWVACWIVVLGFHPLCIPSFSVLAISKRS
ncbi:hypothetical protein EA661_12020 [Pseudoxanthomonas winnipegensis]|uniref:Uncharacterized protein n=1 Tax=Pseudoxanthomonas winnipegensis TaxID=2480810 RepID=A0A4Q8LHP3_9GAMM|nr:hypothetical protein [Pseudoxanthomonas winnipegensis]TAA29011.1 hypothetical protein EA661_12020 [Pseudoxanthomonas winnipegensis]